MVITTMKKQTFVTGGSGSSPEQLPEILAYTSVATLAVNAAPGAK